MQKGKVLIKRENLTPAQPARGKRTTPYSAEQGVVTALWSYLHPLSPRRHPIARLKQFQAKAVWQGSAFWLSQQAGLCRILTGLAFQLSPR